MFQYSFSKSKSYFCTLLIVSYLHRTVSVPARGTEKDSLTAVFFRATCLRLTGGLIPQTRRGPLILLLKKRSRVGSLTRSVPQHLPEKRPLAWKVPGKKAGPSRKTAPGMEGPRGKGRTFQENGPWHGRSPEKRTDLPGKRPLAWKVPGKKAGPSRKMAPGMEGRRTGDGV